MTTEEIEKKCKEVLSERGVGAKLGYVKQEIYNFRHRKMALSTMLEILYRADKLKFK